MRRSLDELGLRFQTDKASSHHGFLGFYERFLDEMRDNARTILEIGVYQAHSLRMWEAYFPKATIIGIDIDPACKQYEAGRVKVEICDQSNPMALAELVARFAPFDLVIDDGAHLWNHQITSLRCLYPHVRPGRFYILEDIDTSFGSYVETYRGISDISAAQYLQHMSNYLIADEMLHDQPEADGFLKTAAAATEFLAFHKRTSVLRRKAWRSG